MFFKRCGWDGSNKYKYNKICSILNTVLEPIQYFFFFLSRLQKLLSKTFQYQCVDQYINTFC